MNWMDTLTPRVGGIIEEALIPVGQQFQQLQEEVVGIKNSIKQIEKRIGRIVQRLESESQDAIIDMTGSSPVDFNSSYEGDYGKYKLSVKLCFLTYYFNRIIVCECQSRKTRREWYILLFFLFVNALN